jgi:hypothetical protein
MCKAVVYLPEPPFSLPRTTTCADRVAFWIGWTNMDASSIGEFQIICDV